MSNNKQISSPEDIDNIILNGYSKSIVEEEKPTLRSLGNLNAKTLKYSLSSIHFLRNGFSNKIDVSFKDEYKRIHGFSARILGNCCNVKNLLSILDNYTTPNHFTPSQRLSINLLISRVRKLCLQDLQGFKASERYFYQKYKFKFNMEEKLKRLRIVTDKYNSQINPK